MRLGFGRRTCLRAGALALPLLNGLRGARAAAPFPQRFIMLYSPNGTIPEAWFPKGDAASYTLGDIMKPLEPHKQDLILFRNVDNMAAYKQPFGDPHGCGTGCLFTGFMPAPGELFKAGMGGPGSGWPNGPSVDQIIAGRIGGSTKLRSLELAVKTMAGSIFSRMSYKSAGVPVAPESDPGHAFDRIFAGVGVDATVSARLRKRRKSVLDEVTGELADVAASMAAVDRGKLEAHLTAVRELEMRLETLDPGATCKKPQRPALGNSAEVKANASGMQTVNAQNDRDVPDRNKMLREMLVMALACDITRVASIMMAPSRSDIVMTWLGHGDSHHEMSHGSRPGVDRPLIECHRFYAEQVAALIAALKAIPEGAGTLFDNTVIVWGNELGVGQDHTRNNIPFLVAGGAGKMLKTGQYINFKKATPQNRILLSVCHALGLRDIRAVGETQFCTDGPVAEMLV